MNDCLDKIDKKNRAEALSSNPSFEGVLSEILLSSLRILSFPLGGLQSYFLSLTLYNAFALRTLPFDSL